MTSRYSGVPSVMPGAEPFSRDDGTLGVLLSHGFTGSPASMKPWGQYLADRGYTVRVPRLPGHGTRWQDLNAVGWDDWYGELDRSLSELRERCESAGAHILRSYRSEREDWIQTMVAAGMGVCFVPEFSATHPGVVVRRVEEPEVVREVCAVTVAGRRWSVPLASFVKAIRRYDWPTSDDVADISRRPDSDAAAATGT